MAISQRDARFDNLKGILIFLVVFGHLLELVGGPAADWLYRLIYSFHMPAFVFCSGWFARFDAERFFRRLLYPYLVYQTLYLLFDRLVLHGKAPLQYTTPYWLLWYLFSMMLWTLLLPLIDGVKNSRAALSGCLAAAMAAGFDPTIGYGMSLSRTLVLLPFFAAGHLAAGGELKSLHSRLAQISNFRLFPVLGGWILISGVMLWLRRAAVRSVWFYASCSYKSAHYDLELRVILLATGAAWILLLLRIVPKHPLPFLASLGQHTLPVFLLHGFFVRSMGVLHPGPGSAEGIVLAACTALFLCAALGNRFTAALFAPTLCAPRLNLLFLSRKGLPSSRPAR